MKINKKIIYIIPIILIMLFINGCSSGTILDPYQYDDTNYKTGNMAFTEPINKINVDWIVGDIIIDESETEEIIIREDIDVNIDDKLKMHYYLNEGLLDIKFCGNLNQINHSYKIKKLYIYIPSNITSLEININNVSSDITASNVKIQKLDIENISGDIDIQKTEIDTLEINNTSGSILLFYLTINNLDIESVSGTIGISYNNKPVQASIESVSGGISIYITENESIAFDFETVSGNFKTNLKYTKDKETYIFNEGQVIFDIETVSGYFKVLKK